MYSKPFKWLVRMGILCLLALVLVYYVLTRGTEQIVFACGIVALWCALEVAWR